MISKLRFMIAIALLAAGPARAQSSAANSLSDMWRGLSLCIGAPGDRSGSELTIVFALKRDGSLLGTPRITHSHLVGDADAQRTFVALAIDSLQKCLPVKITDGLGGAIAGRMFALRFASRPREIHAWATPRDSTRLPSDD
jgi:hypothetical protein